MTRLIGRRVMLRPLTVSDYVSFREVRMRNKAWLTKWEPSRTPGALDPAEDRDTFAARCGGRERERQMGVGFGFGIFVSGQFCGEINLNQVQRGPFQNAYVGYWIDERTAGQGYTPEACAVVFRHAFEDLHLHRLQISIIPRNTPSRRVVEKLRIRDEGIAERYLEIDGVWEDHHRYAITSEEWTKRRDGFMTDWIS